MNIKFHDQQGKNKEIQKGIKQLLCLKSKDSTLPSKLIIINEQKITNDNDQLNKLFSSTGKKLGL